MSGEAYYIREQQLRDMQDQSDNLEFVLESVRLIVHEINWGDSADSCRECKERSALAGLRAFASEEATIDSVRNGIQAEPWCPDCEQQRYAT